MVLPIISHTSLWRFLGRRVGPSWKLPNHCQPSSKDELVTYSYAVHMRFVRWEMARTAGTEQRGD